MAGALALTVLLLAGDARVAVIAPGEDPAAAGASQHAAEERLAAAGVRLLPAAQFAKLLGVHAPTAPSVDLVAQRRLKELMDAAAKAYYEDRLDAARGFLDAAEAQLEGRGAAASDRVRVTLWRAALALVRTDEAGARKLVGAALAIEPGLVVDLNVFPPSVAEIVEAVRKQPSRTFEVSFALPPGAAAFVDDKPVGRTARLREGTHWLVVTAPGMRPVASTFDVKTSVTLKVGLAPALGGPARQDIDGILWSDAPSARALDELASRLGVDAVVLVGSRGPRSRAVVAWRGTRRALVRDSEQEATTLDWLASTVARGPAVETSDRGVRIDVQAGITAGARTSTVSGGGGRAATTSAAAGPRLSAMLSRGPWRAGLEGAYAASPGIDVERGGESGTGGDASALSGRVLVGWGHAFGRSMDAPTLTFLAGGLWEEIAARDALGLALFPSHRRIALEARVAGSMAVVRGGAWPVTLVGSAGVTPLGIWSETPEGWSGKDPRMLPGWSARLGAEAVRRWTVRAEVSIERSGAAFRGVARAPLSPALFDASRSDVSHAVTLSVGRSL